MAVGTSLHLDHLERFIRKLGMKMKYEREMIVVEKARGYSTPRAASLSGTSSYRLAHSARRPRLPASTGAGADWGDR